MTALLLELVTVEYNFPIVKTLPVWFGLES